MNQHKNDLLDAIIDLGLEMKAIRKLHEKTNERLENMDKRLEHLEREQIKTNALLAENSRAIIKLANRQDDHAKSLLVLADKLKIVVNHEQRIGKLEKIAFV